MNAQMEDEECFKTNYKKAFYNTSEHRNLFETYFWLHSLSDCVFI